MRKVLTELVQFEFDLVVTVDRGDQVSSAVDVQRPDVVLLDISLPGRSGLQVLPELRRRYEFLVLIVVTTNAGEAYRNEAVRRGADACVLKDDAASELVPAIRTAVATRCSRRDAVCGWS